MNFPFLPMAVADHVKLVFPDPHTGVVELPLPGVRGLLSPGGGPLIIRDYTVRSFDSDVGELAVDFVVHPHGPAGRWGAAAVPSCVLGVLGPRGSQVYPANFAHYLLVADGTGVPALERFLEELPSDVTIDVIVLGLAGSANRVLGGRIPTSLEWLIADDPTTGSDLLIDVLKTKRVDETPSSGAPLEAGVIRAARQLLLSLPYANAQRVELRGYWRVGASGALSQDRS